MGKPRIFVSSTYYDLKHIRNNLKRFIVQYSFDPVLNEFGNISYDHNKPLDKSCFDEVKLCDMLILIIGGRYGSSISEHNIASKQFYDEYTSITSQEFRTAFNENIPVYIFIEKSVDSEYYTYLKNKDNLNVQYAHVDSVNIFKFIEEIKSNFTNNIIFTFERFEHIENQLKEQWSGIFYNYLKRLRESKNEISMLNSMNKLEMVVGNINEMVNLVGKKLNNNTDEYEDIINKQNKKLILFYAEKIGENIGFERNKASVITSEQVNPVVELIYHSYFNCEILSPYIKYGLEISDELKYELLNKLRDLRLMLNSEIHKICENISITGLFFTKTYLEYNLEVLPLIKTDKDLEQLFKDKLENVILKNLLNS